MTHSPLRRRIPTGPDSDDAEETSTQSELADSDGDGISDTIEIGADWTVPVDTDGDVTDALDTDSDDDGLIDQLEVERRGPPRDSTMMASSTSGKRIHGGGVPDGVEVLSTKPIRRSRTTMDESWKRALLSKVWDATERIRRSGGDLFYSSVLVAGALDVVASSDPCLLSRRRAK